MAANSPRRVTGTATDRALVPQLGVRVAGTSCFLPQNIVTNGDLAALGCDDQWIVQRTGIHERRIALPEQATSDLAAGAGLACLEAAGVAASEVDLILVATCTPDHIAPSVSCLVQERLGCNHAAAFDLNAACSGFMYGYITAAQFVATGVYRNVLLIGADVLSKFIDPKDVKTFPLFGDGAAAMLLQPSGRRVVTREGHSQSVPMSGDAGILGFELGAEGSLGRSLLFPAGGTRQPISPEVLAAGGQYLQMDGRTVFKWAVGWIPQVINRVLHRIGLTTSDIDLFVLHQANSRIIDAAMEGLQIGPEKVWTNLAKYGNTCAASIPLALHEAEASATLGSGRTVLMCGFGAGLTWGTAVVRW